MAKGKTAAAETKEKKVRPKKEPKDSYLKDNYIPINEYNGIRTSAMPIRGIGCNVREEVLNAKGEVVSVSSTFIPGVKVKTKKDWKYLIIDKGPKSKASSEEEDDVEELIKPKKSTPKKPTKKVVGGEEEEDEIPAPKAKETSKKAVIEDDEDDEEEED